MRFLIFQFKDRSLPVVKGEYDLQALMQSEMSTPVSCGAHFQTFDYQDVFNVFITKSYLNIYWFLITHESLININVQFYSIFPKVNHCSDSGSLKKNKTVKQSYQISIARSCIYKMHIQKGTLPLDAEDDFVLFCIESMSNTANIRSFLIEWYPYENSLLLQELSWHSMSTYRDQG